MMRIKIITSWAIAALSLPGLVAGISQDLESTLPGSGGIRQ